MAQILGILIAVFSSYAYATTGVPTSVVLFSLLTLIIIVSAILYVLIRFCKGPKKKPKDFDSRYISIEMVSKRSGKSVDTLINEIQAGKLKGKEFQRGWFVAREELIRLKI